MSHPDSELFSRLLDGDLSDEERGGLEVHLVECEECRALLRELGEVRHRARQLRDLPPVRDLWPEILGVLEGMGAPEPEVIPLPSARQRVPTPRQRRWGRPSYPQMAAAGVVLALLSGLTGAALARRGSPGVAADGPSLPAWVQQVELASPELGGSAQEVAHLEEILARYREELDPATVRIVQKSLGVIDQAIQESLAALELDPGNRFLRDHLERAIQAKAEYLRDATSLVAPVG